MQRFCHPCFVFFGARAEIARAGRAADHQYARCQAMREFFSNEIDSGTNFARHAFHEVLSNKEHRLDCSDAAKTILEYEVMMFKIAVQRLIDDFVVTMVLALVLKRVFPGATILQLGQRNDLSDALREWNDVANWHETKKADRINLPTRKDTQSIGNRVLRRAVQSAVNEETIEKKAFRSRGDPKNRD